jgi:hypothetical protein
MSGAPVIASGCLLGVVSERAPRQGPSTLTAVPLTALQADPAHKEWGPGVADPAAWWSRLGVEGADRLQRLPVPQSTQLDPAYVTFYISYRRDQSSFIARSLRSVLASRLGEANVFMDTAAISPDQELPRESQVAMLDCRVMLVIIGPYWLTAREPGSGSRRLDDPEDWVRREVEQGLARPELAVVPVLVDGALMPSHNDLPPSLRSLSDRNAFVLTGENFEREVDALIEGIQRGQRSPLTARPVQDRSAPPADVKRQGFWSRFRRR